MNVKLILNSSELDICSSSNEALSHLGSFYPIRLARNQIAYDRTRPDVLPTILDELDQSGDLIVIDPAKFC